MGHHAPWPHVATGAHVLNLSIVLRVKEMQASDVRDLDAASWAVVLSPTRDMTPSGMKLCMECGALKELTEFRKDTLRHDGRKSQCKACLKEIEVSWRHGPERAAQSAAERRAAGRCMGPG